MLLKSHFKPPSKRIGVSDEAQREKHELVDPVSRSVNLIISLKGAIIF